MKINAQNETFQFQYGAIIRTCMKRKPVSAIKFQFQYGAIIRLTIDCAPTIKTFRFNSSMVQLLVLYALTTVIVLSSFNSSMVQLLAAQRPCFNPIGFLFQFQYGAIIRKTASIALASVILFQFQYGAIIRT